MKIDLYRLTQNDNDEFREMVREYADSYLEMLTLVLSLTTIQKEG